jgi:hypothetical protein
MYDKKQDYLMTEKQFYEVWERGRLKIRYGKTIENPDDITYQALDFTSDIFIC